MEQTECTIRLTTELCQEDRERIDRLTAALERVTNRPAAEQPEDDPIRAALAEQVAKSERAHAESLENAPGGTEAETPTLTSQPEEKQSQEKPAAKVSRADVRAKVIALSAAGKKDLVREVVHQYADKVTAIPEDKLTECFDKLAALE